MALSYRIGDEPIPGYRLVEFLGRGGIGEVWRARAPGGPFCALKIIHLIDKQAIKEYRALRLVKKLRNPHLVPINAIWLREANGQLREDSDELDSVWLRGKDVELFIAMGLGDKNLADRLQECREGGKQGIPSGELLDYMEAAAKGIDFLNQRSHDIGSGQDGIQHCDIKPQNILIVGGDVQVCDFGLARPLNNFRKTSTTAGTFLYIAPELLQDCTSRSGDQYSLAISYYELRTGVLPLNTESLLAIVNAHIDGKLDFSKVLPFECEVLRRATALNPEERFPTTLEMVKALRHAVETSSTSRPSSGSGGRAAPLPSESRQPLSKESEGERNNDSSLPPSPLLHPAGPLPQPHREPETVESPVAVVAEKATPSRKLTRSPYESRIDTRDTAPEPPPTPNSAAARNTDATSSGLIETSFSPEPPEAVPKEPDSPRLAEKPPAEPMSEKDTAPSESSATGLNHLLPKAHSGRPPRAPWKRKVMFWSAVAEPLAAALILWACGAFKPGPPPVETRTSFKLKLPSEIAIKAGSRTAFELRAERTGLVGPIRVTFAEVPAKVQLEWTTIPDGMDYALIRVEAAPDAAIGNHGVNVIATSGEAKDECRLKLIVARAPALHLSIPDGLTLRAGAKQSFTVRASREGIEGEITLRMEKLPTGIATKKVTIPANGIETEVELTAAYNAERGEKEITVVALAGATESRANLKLTLLGPRAESVVPPIYAKQLSPKEITNSIGMRLVLIPAGTFQMGSADSDKEAYHNEKPLHGVEITKGFYLDKYEVTRGQFQQFVEDTGYKTDAEKDGLGGYGYDAATNSFKGPLYNSEKRALEGPGTSYSWRDPGFEQTNEHPVVNVSWNDAKAFCDWLSKKEGRKYRLPTEAEWEYSCRAGTTTRYASGDDPETLAKVGNVADGTAKKKFPDWTTITAEDGYVFTAPVGQFQPNAFGLYDMHGNAWEWCADWYDAKYYHNSPAQDPEGPDAGSFRVIRGGSFYRRTRYCRAADRHRVGPAHRWDDLGFRVVLVPPN
jgi:formylglycine-generating enzyme required for sulfatase activity/serine/threonine protein kinase